MLLLPNRRGLWGADWCREPLWRRAGERPSWHIAPARTGNIVDLVAGQQLVTFTNSSPAWGWNSAGLLIQPAANTPFIEYNPATGECLGWRMWDQVANLLLHSRDLAQTAWVKSGITPTRDQVGADGSANTATRLTATSSDGTALQTITSASATRVSGFLIKRITGNGVIQITQDGGATWNTVSITNQWLRYSIAAATVTNPQIGFRIRSSGDEIAVDFAQLQSAAALGPPVATGAISASSAADVASITGSNFSAIWNAAEMTIYAEGFVRAQAIAAAYPRLFTAVGANTGNDEIGIYSRAGVGTNDGAIFASSTVSGAIQADLLPLSGSAVNNYRSAFAFKANDFALCNNGISPSGTAIDTSGSLPSVSEFRIYGQARFQPQPAGYVRELALLRSRRPNVNMQGMAP